MAYIARSLSALLERTPADKAIVVFGARQTGKTTLLEHLFQDRKVKWLSGDEPHDRELLTSLSSKADISILLSGLDVLVIDEAQRIQGIGMLLKRLEDSKPSCRIFATGSQFFGIGRRCHGVSRGTFVADDSFSIVRDRTGQSQ